MKRATRDLRIALALSVVGTLSIVSAEVSTQRVDTDRVRLLLMDRTAEITDGADPVPQVRWEPYRPATNANTLNIMGAVRPDGRPDAVLLPGNDWPFVVWAYNNGNDHDIAFAEWTGTDWGPVRFLTSSVEDERDPRAFVTAGGTLYVVWWVDDDDPRVMIRSRSAVSLEWTAPTRVTGLAEPGRHPSVALYQGTLRIAYERRPEGESAPTSGALVIVRFDNDAGWTIEHEISVPRGSEVDPVLHTRNGLWVAWKHSDTHFGYARFENGGWGSTTLRAWEDESWVGVESMHRSINRELHRIDLGSVAPNDPSP